MSRTGRLDDLFVRYWDDTLTPAEANELAARLRDDPAAQVQFQSLCVQAVAAAEGVPIPVAVQQRGWSRRRVLKAFGVGLAAGVVPAAVVGGWYYTTHDPLRLVSFRGMVKFLMSGGTEPTVGSVVPPGGTIGTVGIGSAAEFADPDGTRVALASDSIVTLTGPGRTLLLRRGAVTADVPERQPWAGELVLATTEAALTRLGGATLTLGHVFTDKLTEFGVFRGRVTVSDPDGSALGEAGGGEMVTVRAGGRYDRRPIAAAPDEFAWAAARPNSPPGWPEALRVVTPDGPVIRTVTRTDPATETDVYRVQSDQRFVPGFFRLDPDTRVRVRYRVEKPGLGQLGLCARTLDSRSPESGMLEWVGTFRPPETPDGWRWLEVRAGDMIDNDHAPRFGPPWVCFQVGFSTFEADLGLQLAEFRATQPGGLSKRG